MSIDTFIFFNHQKKLQTSVTKLIILYNTRTKNKFIFVQKIVSIIYILILNIFLSICMINFGFSKCEMCVLVRDCASELEKPKLDDHIILVLPKKIVRTSGTR